MTDIEGVGDHQQRYEIWVRMDGEKEMVRMGWADDPAPLIGEGKSAQQIWYVEVRDREDNDKVVDTWRRPRSAKSEEWFRKQREQAGSSNGRSAARVAKSKAKKRRKTTKNSRKRNRK